MKIKVLTLLCCLIILMGCSCDNSLDYVIEGYQSSDEHFDDHAWKDHTDYCEYYYTAKDISLFQNSQYHLVTNQDINKLKGFVTRFLEVVEYQEGYQQWCHFNLNMLSTEDYFYLRIIEPDEVYGEYHCYDLYYYDVSECTLYYMSNYN